MKLIIDIPEVDYECAKQRWMSGNDAHKTDYYISKGIPLDDVKTEIEEKAWDTQEIDGEHDNYKVVDLSDVLDVLDNIGKAESEDKE